MGKLSLQDNLFNKGNNEYRVVNTTNIGLGRFLIHLDTIDKNGSLYPYSYVEQKNSVGVLAFCGDKIVLIRQYRHTMKTYEYEIPGGEIIEGENPLEVAKREMLEETGYLVDTIEKLGVYYPSPGSSNEKCYLYKAYCHQYSNPKHEPLEYMTIELVGEGSFNKMILNNSIKHGMGLVAWLYYIMKRDKK